jgi:hypothetical protein
MTNILPADMNNGNNNNIILFALVFVVGVATTLYAIRNGYLSSNTVQTDVASKQTLVQLGAELDTISAKLKQSIEEQKRLCKTPVYITEPFIVGDTGQSSIEATIILKIQYLRWQIEVVLTLSRMNNTDSSPTPSPKPRPGTGSIGMPAGMSFGDSL